MLCVLWNSCFVSLPAQHRLVHFVPLVDQLVGFGEHLEGYVNGAHRRRFLRFKNKGGGLSALAQ